ncbi:HAD family hydrolase [Cellulomonas hominis]
MPRRTAAGIDPHRPVLDGVDAVLFDLDGVLTPTAEVHMRAWSRLFTGYFTDRGVGPAYRDDDYFAYIDGKPRYEGVAAMLASRGITLPLGTPEDGPDVETVCGLGNRKNAAFSEVLETEGVEAYPGSVALVDALIAAGRQVAVVSSSKNATAVLAAAGLSDRFGVVIDGVVAVREGLAGKPEPRTYEYAAEVLGVPSRRAAVVEDALSGVAAGHAGDFAVVIGVDRGVGAQALIDVGADVVVGDLADLLPDVPTSPERDPA